MTLTQLGQRQMEIKSQIEAALAAKDWKLAAELQTGEYARIEKRIRRKCGL